MKRARKIALRVGALVDFYHRPRPMGELLLEAVAEECNISPDDAAELAEGLADGVLEELVAIEAEAASSGIACTFTFSSLGTHLIQGSAHSDPGLDARINGARRMRAASPYVQEYLNTLTPRQFEFLCRGVLHLLGCASPQVTSRSADQGLDFYGRLSVGDILSHAELMTSLHRDLTAWVAGQAKHTPNGRVDTHEVRHMVGSVAMARAGVLARGGETLQGFAPRFVEPVYVAIFTTGTFSRDARGLASRSGVITLDGVQLATFLCDHGVGLDADGEFAAERARAWLDGQQSDAAASQP